MKILIIGEWYSSNLGDGIICENVKRIIENSYECEKIEIKKADISCRKGFLNEDVILQNERRIRYLKKLLHKSEYLTYKLQDLKRRKVIKKICQEKYDIAIFAGGHLIMPYFTFQLYDFVKYLSKMGTKIVFNACGIGEIKSKILLHKIRKTLSNESIIHISTRDDIEKLTKKYLKKTNKIPVRKTYDPAIYTDETYKIEKDARSEIIGLGVMNLVGVEKATIITFWKQIITELEKEGKKWQLFCNGSQEDYNLACECLSALRNNRYKKDTAIAPKPDIPEELIHIISKYKSIISFRLHSHITAYSLGIPAIPIVWNDKVKFFFEDINLEDRCFYIQDSPIRIVEKLLEIENSKYDELIKREKKKEIKNNILVFKK